MLELTLQTISTDSDCPAESRFYDWISLVLDNQQCHAEITVRLVDEAEITELNQRYRNKDHTTNVLSFLYNDDNLQSDRVIGDIVISVPVVNREAKAQGKTLEAHWAHLVMHGTLHLLGYDHVENEDAKKMELLECKLMQQLGYADPYVIADH